MDNNFIDSLFSKLMSIDTVTEKIVSNIQEAVSELKKTDTYLTEISRTNQSLTSSDLERIGNRAFSTASNYGQSATDYLSNVLEMSRAGYKDVEAMAELSAAVQTAGSMTADAANKMITTTNTAYNLGDSVKELTQILDGVNWICDNNAVSMAELSEGMSIVGATAASSGVDVNELIASLATMAGAAQQSGSEAAHAFKAILLNIRQVEDAEEGIDAEGLAKYEKACNALNVKLKETKNGVRSLRDPMEVLKELSVKYNELGKNDVRKTNLLAAVGSSQNADSLDAILSQWDVYEQMLGQYADGTGSMASEAEQVSNSWEGSLKRLSNTWTDTVGNIADSDAIITIINGLNGLLSVVNSVTNALGSIGSIGIGVGVVQFIKNFDWLNKSSLRIA